MNQKAILYLLTSSTLLGIFVVLNKAALNTGLNPISLALFTFLVAGIFSIFYLAPKSKALTKIKRKEWIYILLVGVIASGIVNILYFLGQELTSAINTSFLSILVIISTSIFAYFMVGERFTRRDIFFASIALFGTFLLTTKGETIIPNKGDIFIIFSSILFGLSNVLAKKAMKNTTGEMVSMLRLVIGALFLLIVTPLLIGSETFTAINGYQYYLVNGLIVVVYVSLFYKGVELTNPGIATVYLLFQTPVATALAFIFLKESLVLIQIIGGILILTGIYFLAKPNKSKTEI